MAHFVYILKCSGHSYYVGSTSNIKKRLEKHKSGQGSVWTSNRLPLELVYQEMFPDKITALKREKQLNGWTRAKKEALINGELESLRSLSKSHSTKGKDCR